MAEGQLLLFKRANLKKESATGTAFTTPSLVINVTGFGMKQNRWEMCNTVQHRVHNFHGISVIQ